MRIHLIAIGGSAMHNLAIALHQNNHTVTGSDDEIYNPARDRLNSYGLLPSKMGWDADRIDKSIDVVIVGMHARKDNPELKKVRKLKLKIVSYPAYLYQHAKDKKRVVVAGSHGKTTTTSMIMHVLKKLNVDYDYMVGAQLEGFDTMVRLSDAPLMIIEGDEYLSSPIDLRPKFLHYKPHIAIITGIAWDHINVFPTFKGYVHQFELFINSINRSGQFFYYKHDKHLQKLCKKYCGKAKVESYEAFSYEIKDGKTVLTNEDGKKHRLNIFGKHNLENLKAAWLICSQLGVSSADFFKSIKSFKGAAKRLQLLHKKNGATVYLDFAHAPSKVAATVTAMKSKQKNQKLVACLELHTFSSLNKQFLKEYKGTMAKADKAIVYFSEHTLKMKKLPPLSKKMVAAAFDHPNLKVFTDNEKMQNALKRFKWENKQLLMMSSGTFNGIDLKKLAKELLNKQKLVFG